MYVLCMYVPFKKTHASIIYKIKYYITKKKYLALKSESVVLQYKK